MVGWLRGWIELGLVFQSWACLCVGGGVILLVEDFCQALGDGVHIQLCEERPWWGRVLKCVGDVL